MTMHSLSLPLPPAVPGGTPCLNVLGPLLSPPSDGLGVLDPPATPGAQDGGLIDAAAEDDSGLEFGWAGCPAGGTYGLSRAASSYDGGASSPSTLAALETACERRTGGTRDLTCCGPAGRPPRAALEVGPLEEDLPAAEARR